MGRPEHAKNLRPHEIDAIVRAVKSRMKAYREGSIKTLKRVYELAGDETGFDWKTVARIYRSMQPTTMAATDLIRARSFRLASRLVKEAKVPEILDILSRPNIGVLEPIKKAGGAGEGGFFISVSAESCGAVQVGVMPGQLPAAQAALPEADPGQLSVEELEVGGLDEDEEESVIITPEVLPPAKEKDPMDRHRPRSPGSNKAYQQQVEKVEALEAKRAKRRQQYHNRKRALQAQK